ncbi:lytic murein transglycosylase [Halobacteriovorax sp. GB3]|uniref:lytic murein transglycosylase n=1 Tax=Halobacteriovorax sp. GB3 TaxID=2719615 RepID=UPI002362B104|nr:lytic murein transglycosylase [Halobacteriovorax sp. GB3]MDD0851704.1 lytic murein transglycosylase [Halobacteriovorax sp. GB3]
MKKTLALILTFLCFTIQASNTKSEAREFEQWKKSYAKWAAKHGIPTSFSLKILKNVTIDPEVIKRDRNQITSSSKVDYHSFIERWLREDNKRIVEGKKLLKENLALLKKIEKDYGVDKEAIISLWGVESFYGKIVGDYNVVRSLSTLAFEGRRRRFYQIQLNAAMRLLRKGHVTFDDFKGSWAGATGQCQFMPSNIPVFGQDYNKDGKIDLWHSKEDIFASIAFLLKKAGWQKGKSIGSLAIKTKDVTFKLDRYRTKSEYNQLGLRTLDKKKLYNESWSKRRAASISLQNAPVVLRGSNYEPLLKWNNSSLFAAFNILIMDSLKKETLSK